MVVCCGFYAQAKTSFVVDLAALGYHLEIKKTTSQIYVIPVCFPGNKNIIVSVLIVKDGDTRRLTEGYIPYQRRSDQVFKGLLTDKQSGGVSARCGKCDVRTFEKKFPALKLIIFRPRLTNVIPAKVKLFAVKIIKKAEEVREEERLAKEKREKAAAANSDH